MKEFLPLSAEIDSAYLTAKVHRGMQRNSCQGDWARKPWSPDETFSARQSGGVGRSGGGEKDKSIPAQRAP